MVAIRLVLTSSRSFRSRSTAQTASLSAGCAKLAANAEHSTVQASAGRAASETRVALQSPELLCDSLRMTFSNKAG
jgi:hypothetical protein